MKKSFQTIRVLALMAFVGCALGFTACSDDDNNNTPPGEVTTEVIQGNYTGKMETLYLNTLADQNAGEDGETPQGVDITATIDKDSICFETFPIKDIVLSIVGDETTADQIVEAVGQVDYKIGYTPTLSAAKDSILFTLDPKPLKLSVNIPGTEEGESLPTAIEVKVQAAEGANYEGKTTALKFGFQASEVLIGEDQTPLEGFTPTTFDFTTVKSRK